MSGEEKNIFVLIVSSTVILLLLVTFIVLFLFIYQRRVYRHKSQMEKMKEDFRQEMLASKMELQEQVLNSVSEEIHDNLGQMLSVVKLNLVKLGRMVGTSEPENEVLNELKEQVSIVINDMRSISKTLSQDFISNFGLAESLKIELDRIRRTGEINTNLKIEGETLNLDGQSQIVLFRIAQELINNAIKHAEAKTISVYLHYKNDGLFMTIEDDGVGFNIDELNSRDASSSGSGLRNMQNRVNIIGGILTLKSTKDEGTKVSISLDTQSNLFINSKK